MVRSWGFDSVSVHRRSTNGGLAACWNECIARARGELIHILHQDDLVKPGFPFGASTRSRCPRPLPECTSAGASSSMDSARGPTRWSSPLPA
jgi:hypothetical protein